MHILCPHCANPIEVVKVNPREEIACPSCGSSFHLEASSTTDATCVIGQTFGRFTLVETVGQGAFGTVYRAHDPELDRTVAVKVPRTGNLAGPGEIDRFLREARSAAQLRHPSIVTVHEVGQQNGIPYLVSDFVQGVTLADLLSARRPSFREAAEVVAAVADALQYAHDRGVVHRDVKPSNIMLAEGLPCVMDFGLAKREAGEITLTVEGQVLGTPAYMSPEQARGEAHRVDGRSDVYSLGVILYQLLTGELPFRGTTRMLLHQVLHDDPRPLRRLNDRIPRDLETICLKALAKETGRRYATAKELAEDLRRWLKGEAILARPFGPFARALRWVRRKPAAAALIGMTSLAALALVGLVVGLIYNDTLQIAYQAESDAHQAESAARQAENEQRRKAESALETAQNALGLAETAKKGEASQRQRAEDALAEARRVAYHHLILLADLAIKENRLPRATVLLGETTVQQREWEYRYLQSRCRPELLSLPMPRPFKADRLVAFSPDGRLLACPGADNTVQIWDAVSGVPLHKLTGPTKPVRCVAFRPGGKQLAVGGEDAARVWDLASGKQLWTHKEPSLSLAYSADGSRLATLGDIISIGGRGTVLDAEIGRPVGKNFNGGGPGGFAYTDLTSDGRRVLSTFWDQATVSDPETGRQLVNLKGHDRTVHGAAFAPDGRIAATGSWDATVKLWDVETGRNFRTLRGHDGEVWCVAFSPDGRLIASGSSDRTIRLWDAASGQVIRTLAGHDGRVLSVTFSPDGWRLGSAGDDGKVKVWDLGPEVQAALLPVPTKHVLGLAFNPDSKLLACKAMSGENLIRVYDVTTRQLAHTLPLVDHGWHGLAYSPDGRWLVCEGPAHGLRLLDPGTGQTLADLAPSDPPRPFAPGQPPISRHFLRAVTVSKDGRHLASLLTDGSLKLWDVPARKERLTLKARAADHIDFSPDGRWLAAPGPGKGARVWNVSTGQVRFELKGHTENVTAVVFSVDGRLLITASGDQTLKIWDATDGTEHRTLRGHSGPVNDVAVHPGGKRIASAAADGTVKLWDLATGQEALTLPGGSSTMVAVAFSPDGRRLAAGQLNPGAILWDAPDNVDSVQRARRRQLAQPQLTLHREAAEETERSQQWFAASFHLGRLLAAEPDDLVVRARHGIALANAGKVPEARLEIRKALDRLEDLPNAIRAEAHAALGEWREAVPFFARAALERPKSRMLPGSQMVSSLDEAERNYAQIERWYKCALIRLHLGDLAGYRAACEEVLKRFGQQIPAQTFGRPLDARSANLVAWLCSLGPDAVSKLPQNLISQAVLAQPKNLVLPHTWGCLMYRTGQHAGAYRMLSTTLTRQNAQGSVTTSNWFHLAMAAHRTGKSGEAKSLLTQMTKGVKPENIPGGWAPLLEWQLLRREAEELINGSSGTKQDRKSTSDTRTDGLRP